MPAEKFRMWAEQARVTEPAERGQGSRASSTTAGHPEPAPAAFVQPQRSRRQQSLNYSP